MRSIVVFGASGDLAKRKTFPALFSLFRHGFLKAPFQIIGYARSTLTKEEFIDRLLPFIDRTGKDFDQSVLDTFIEHCSYVHGGYDEPEGYHLLERLIGEGERKDTAAEPGSSSATGNSGSSSSSPNDPSDALNSSDDSSDPDSAVHTRIFYLALPPSVFLQAAQGIKAHLYLSTRSSRVIIEKPFGKDFESSRQLSKALSKLYVEAEIYRIDHYLGKEMVKNLMVLRFGNLFFNELWNRHCVASVQIVFKETIGVEGRGGYFDEYGIIRDVMQNHLLQMLTVVAMERPASLAAEDVRDEKVKVLRCIEPLALDRMILGQYGPSSDGSKPGYTEDATVPADSRTPTFAMAVMYVKNERWDGIPFILRSGKGLNEQKAEIRIQFKDVPGLLFSPGVARNELVIRVQPNEAVYLKMVVKRPGLDTNPILSDLDLSYATRYHGLRIPEAYESLLLDVLKSDQSSFVRADELEAAWKVFTPVLHQIDRERVQPLRYPFGSRGPEDADSWLERIGYQRHGQHYSYAWPRQDLQ